MRITDDVLEIIKELLSRFEEGKNEDWLNGFIEALDMDNGMDSLKKRIVSDFVYLLFDDRIK